MIALQRQRRISLLKNQPSLPPYTYFYLHLERSSKPFRSLPRFFFFFYSDTLREWINFSSFVRETIGNHIKLQYFKWIFSPFSTFFRKFHFWIFHAYAILERWRWRDPLRSLRFANWQSFIKIQEGTVTFFLRTSESYIRYDELSVGTRRRS